MRLCARGWQPKWMPFSVCLNGTVVIWLFLNFTFYYINNNDNNSNKCKCTQFLAIWWPNTKCGTYSMNVLHAFDYHSLWCNFTWKFPCFTITFVKHYGDCSYRSVTQQSNAWLFKMCGHHCSRVTLLKCIWW